MRVRSFVDADTASTPDSSSDVTHTTPSTVIRTFLLVAVGAAAVAYAVSRFAASRDEDLDTSLETFHDRATDAVPSAVSDRVQDVVPAEPQPVPIGGRGSADETGADPEPDADTSSDPADTDEPTGGDTSDDATDSIDADAPIDDSEANADLADEPSSTKITSGSSDEIQDKPAEPGEMSVEEDLEDAIGEDVSDENDGESGFGRDDDESTDDDRAE